MKMWDNFIREVNPFYHSYFKMMEMEQKQQKEAERKGTLPASVSMYFKRYSGDDPRRYNIPKVGEISVVFSSEDGEPPIDRCIRVFPKKYDNIVHDGLKDATVINTISQNCDPMVYTILFPFGEPGWRPGLEHTLTKRLGF